MSNFDLQVLVNGKPVKEYSHNGHLYVEGREDVNFSLKFHNNSKERVLIVPSIDGLSVLDGERATPESDGYIIDGKSSYIVKGWRTSMDEVREFVFKLKGDSFAEKTNKGTANCGVIGCLVFSEKEKIKLPVMKKKSTIPWKLPVPDWEPYNYPIGGDRPRIMYSAQDTSSRQMDIGSMALSSNISPDFDLGTGYGSERTDSVREVEFEKGPCLCSIDIFYASKKSLEAVGINLSKEAGIQKMPESFERKFCVIPE